MRDQLSKYQSALIKCVADLSTLFMMLSVSAPFLTAQFRRLVTLSELLREIPAAPALGAANTAKRAEAKTIVLPE